MIFQDIGNDIIKDKNYCKTGKYMMSQLLTFKGLSYHRVERGNMSKFVGPPEFRREK